MSETSERPLDIKWIVISLAILGGLNTVLKYGLADLLGPPLVESMGLEYGVLLYALIIAFLSFFGGGLAVAFFSPGDTTKEPALGALLAIAWTSFLYLRDIGFQIDGGAVVGILISAAVAFAFAMLGAKVGEKLQGDTTDKMRERGDLRG